MRIKLFQTVVFDGKTLEGEIETNGTAISAESIIQRGWGVEVKSSKASQEPVESDPPSEDPDQDEADEPKDEQPSEQPAEQPVVVEPPKKPRKK
jgi:hypothetical protein